MTTKIKFTITGLVCVLTGSLLLYFQNYKDSGVINGLSYFSILIGWVIIFFSVAGHFLVKEKQITSKENKSQRIKRKTVSTIFYLIMCGLAVINIVAINKLTENRVSKILSTLPTKQTVAIVTKIESKNSSGGTKSYAVIEYTANNKLYSKEVFNDGNHYSVGQQYALVYSIEYPEMYRLITLVN